MSVDREEESHKSESSHAAGNAGKTLTKSLPYRLLTLWRPEGELRMPRFSRKKDLHGLPGVPLWKMGRNDPSSLRVVSVQYFS
jgi:hypothetical protein